MTYTRCVLAATFLCLLGIRYADGAGPAAQSSNWPAHVEQFLADHLSAHPDEAARAGKHEYDGQLPDFSEAGLQKEIRRLHAERAKTAAFTDDKLDDRQRFERDYLL